MISFKQAVYPVVAAAALVLVVWQPMDVAPVVAKPSAAERSVSNDMGTWLPIAAPVVAPSASSKV